MPSSDDNTFVNFMFNAITTSVKQTNFPKNNKNIFDDSYKRVFISMYVNLIQDALSESVRISVAGSDMNNSFPISFITYKGREIHFIWWGYIREEIESPTFKIRRVFNECHSLAKVRKHQYESINLDNFDADVIENTTLKGYSQTAIQTLMFLFLRAYVMFKDFLYKSKKNIKYDYNVDIFKLITLKPSHENGKELFGLKYNKT